MKLSAEELTFYNRNRPESIAKMACWSPVKNMFIGMRGKVMTCCYNKSYLLGEYPQQTLHEIWFGENRTKLTESLKNNDFSMGCQNCLETIKAKNINGLTAKKFDYLPLHGTYPTRIDFELSNECNLECKMCRGEFSSSIRKNVEKLPPIQNPYNTDLLEQIKEFIPYLTQCHFLGGEPFLIPIYIDIWDLISKLNPSIRVSLVTNASILSDRVKKILEKLNFDIAVSIDSVDIENYEQIRKNAKLQKVKYNIQYLREYTLRKNTHFNLSACAMSINSHEFIDLVNYANSLNCEVFFTRVSYPRELSLEIQSEEYLETLPKKIKMAHLPNETPTQIRNLNVLNDLANHIESWKRRSSKFIASKSIEAYFNGLELFLKSKSPNEYDGLFENIKSKIIYILEVADKNKMEQLAEKKICEVPFTTMHEMVPAIEKEHLLHLFKSFVLPIEN